MFSFCSHARRVGGAACKSVRKRVRRGYVCIRGPSRRLEYTSALGHIVQSLPASRAHPARARRGARGRSALRRYAALSLHQVRPANLYGPSLQGAPARQTLHGGVPLIDWPNERPKERIFGGYLTSADVERLYPARVARIARGELTYADRRRINEEVSRIDQEWRGGHFNGIDYFHFRFPEQGARMAAFLMKQRLHRLVPGSSQAPTPDEVDAEGARMAQEREAILSWARSTRMLIEIVQAYRFERRQGAYSSAAHAAAARGVEKGDPSVGGPMPCAGVCIELAARRHRQCCWPRPRDRPL